MSKSGGRQLYSCEEFCWKAIAKLEYLNYDSKDSLHIPSTTLGLIVVASLRMVQFVQYLFTMYTPFQSSNRKDP